ncbi:MAG: glycosyltransferase family 2 protein [Chloroflexi bacterium]|nr:glycosyltransferase family 2 protein [Chloroflexota bacterium]
MVNFQARDYLRGCLDSIAAHPPPGEYEIIIVDNGSTDGSLEMLAQDYPHVQVIRNAENRGYTAPTNQGLRAGGGRYLMLLNNDTVIHPHAFERLIEFMDARPEVGICSPKVLNADGTLQKPCRRGESRPWAVLTYFLGLPRFFPKVKLFGGYLLDYMPEDATYEVAGVSGSCMLVRRAVTDQIGFLDELFFAYQEDDDFCLRARRAGWKVYYLHTALVTHFGGRGGSRVQPYRSIVEWHRSYYLHYRKNMAKDYFFLFNWFYYLAMLLKLALALALNALRREKAAGPWRPAR